jgi:D-amino-acid dehydrogenase
VEAAAVPLRDIALLSQHEYELWTKEMSFAYEQKGMLEIFQTNENAEHAAHTVHQGKELGLDIDLIDYKTLQALEPQAKINAQGAIYFKCDAHLYPDKLMVVLKEKLENAGVKFIANETVTGFEKTNKKITKVITDRDIHDTDYCVLATGSWSRELAKMLDIKVPLVGGRGYSVTLENSPYKVNHPAVLVEGRAALTPMNGNKIRFGGTMEITALNTPPRMNRVEGILKAVKDFFPEFDVPMPTADKVWYGFRPCSADGLPYIGTTKKWDNLVIATGHSMLGLSLGAGTGKLVDEFVNGKKLSMEMKPFSVERFS